TLRQIAAVKDQQNFVAALSFSPNGQLLASGELQYDPRIEGLALGVEISMKSEIKLLDIPSGKLRATLKGNGKAVGPLSFSPSVAFSPDGRWLAFVADDEIAELWDITKVPPN